MIFRTNDVARGLLLTAWLLAASSTAADEPQEPPFSANDNRLADQPFLKEYPLGVNRVPMDGGRIYGWKVNDKVTFGKLRGENDAFGFSVELSKRQRVEITTDGLRWRKAIGGQR